MQFVINSFVIKAVMKTRALCKMPREEPVGEKAPHPCIARYHF